MILEAEATEVLTLPEFLRQLDDELDVQSESSLLAMAPKLLGLAKNRRFLATYLAESLASAHFQRNNEFTESAATIVLGSGAGYLVRAVAWPPQTALGQTPSGRQLPIYDEHADVRLAHTHSFRLLTVGYWGPGYETDVYECDADCVRTCGAALDLRFVGRYRLSEGTVLYYPANRVAHVQHAPAEYSISVNVIVMGHDYCSDQHFIDVRRKRIVGAGGPNNQPRITLLRLARAFPDPSFVPYLRTIATGHPSARVRGYALEALRPCELRGGGSSAL